MVSEEVPTRDETVVLEPFYQNLDTDPITVLNAFVHSWLLEDSLVHSFRTGAMMA